MFKSSVAKVLTLVACLAPPLSLANCAEQEQLLSSGFKESMYTLETYENYGYNWKICGLYVNTSSNT